MRQRLDGGLAPPLGPESCTGADWLLAVRPHLAETLVDRPALERLQSLARYFPGDAMSALEIRLGTAAAVVDLSLRLTRPAQARWMAEHTASPQLRTLLLRWSGDWAENDLVSSLWLEFDLDRESFLPSVCAGLRAPAEPGWVAGTLLPRLHGGTLNGEQRQLIELCCAAIPPEARLLYAFSLRSRGAGEVRLEVLGLDPAGILRYLERTAPPTREQVSAVLPLFAGVERLHLSLDIGDVGERISPRVGIEGSFVRLPHREPRWRELFDRLEDWGLCSPEKRRAVFAWPGYDSARTAAGPWPPGVKEEGVRCVRSLSHVKVVTFPGRRPEAKVYLLVTPLRPSPPRRDRSTSLAPEG